MKRRYKNSRRKYEKVALLTVLHLFIQHRVFTDVRFSPEESLIFQSKFYESRCNSHFHLQEIYSEMTSLWTSHNQNSTSAQSSIQMKTGTYLYVANSKIWCECLHVSPWYFGLQVFINSWRVQNTIDHGQLMGNNCQYVCVDKINPVWNNFYRTIGGE
jgi:hypothetical protein